MDAYEATIARVEGVCQWAARRGDLRTLMAARANGHKWDASVCAVAAEKGYLDVLQWARANGCPWDERVCGAAARYGDLNMLQWALGNGCPGNIDNLGGIATMYGQHAVAQWLRARGYSG
jgi:hypothetical protein